MHRPPEQAHRVLAENRRRYDRLVDVVRTHAAAGDTERVLRSATLAAAHGWWAPMGLLADPELERLVVRTSRRAGPPPTVDGERDTGRVLYVLTEAYVTGGHTRLAWRWMSRDPRVGEVVLTHQQGEVPRALVEVAQAQGTSVHDLARTHPDLTARVTALRVLMDRADLVVLHVHPYDAVALAAANLPGPRPPIIYENHADHAYWLGVGAADVVCDLRTSASRLSRGLRGVAPERIGLLPLPLEVPPSAGTAAEVRAGLGVAPDAVVAVIGSSENKDAASWGRGMDGLLGRALAMTPHLAVVLAGVPSTGAWERLAKRYPGRFLAVGHVDDPGPYYAMADVYLDGYPTRAVTSVLEAALLGLPVLTIQDMPADEYAHIFQSDSPGMVGLPRVHTAEQYSVALRRLVSDPRRRAREGAAAQASVRDAHSGEAWLAAMEQLYAQARALPAADVETAPTPAEDSHYGAMVIGFNSPLPRSLELETTMAGLGGLCDPGLRADVFAAFNRDTGSRLQVRVSAGWERDTAWTTRLLALAGARPRLVLSLPFIAGDDLHGTDTTARLVALLADLGQTPDDCGDISVDSAAPRHDGPVLPGELQISATALEDLAAVLSSPCWTEATDPSGGTGGRDRSDVLQPHHPGAAGDRGVPTAAGLSSVLP